MFTAVPAAENSGWQKEQEVFKPEGAMGRIEGIVHATA
jgi:hypothetical protein